MYHYKEEKETATQRCDAPGCQQEAEHRAPKSHSLRAWDEKPEYHWFCLEHVREYNKSWNYFEGMSQDEIEQFQKEAMLGHRPTWNHQTGSQMNEQKLYAQLRGWWAGQVPESSAEQEWIRPITPKVRRALEKLSLPHPSTPQAVKAQYKKLVKQYHPDVNQGDKEAEERFKVITESYTVLVEQYISEQANHA